MTTCAEWSWLALIMMVAALIITATPVAVTGSTCVNTWKCMRAASTITLDAKLEDWSEVKERIVTELRSIVAKTYEDGNATLKCLYDDTNIYFAVEIPGLYRFNATDYHQCPSIATMTKMGANATFVGMGGCTDLVSGCANGVLPTSCDAYRVDVGGFWLLNDATPNVEYSVGGDAVGMPPIDSYAVTPECRVEDDGDNGGNEWRAAWAHSDPQEGAAGEYIFELARPLSTLSATTDAQYAPGNIYQMGVAFWDPYETDTGFTDAGHYVTGCANGWIELELVTDAGSSSTSESEGDSNKGNSTGGNKTDAPPAGDSGAAKPSTGSSSSSMAPHWLKPGTILVVSVLAASIFGA